MQAIMNQLITLNQLFINQLSKKEIVLMKVTH